MKADINISSMLEVARSTAQDVSLKASSSGASLREAAEQFEAIFLNEFIKQARKAKLAEDIFGSDAQDTYQEMMDRELSTKLAGRTDLGIAEALIRQFGQEGYD